MTSANKPWPPLIVAHRVPRLVRWRDALLTSIMWALFAILVKVQFAPILSALQALGLADFGVKVDWPSYLERLTPFLLTTILLVGLLVAFGLRTAWRLSRALPLPQPAPLAAVDQARRAGLDEAALIAAREQPVVVVHANESGFRIESKRVRIQMEGEKGIPRSARIERSQ